MKILYISGLHPLPNNHSAGIFITNRLVGLKKAGIDFLSVVPVDQRDLFTRSLLSLLRKGKSINIWPTSLEVSGIQYLFYPVKMNILSRFMEYEKNSKWFFKEIKKNVDVKSFSAVHAHFVYPHGHIAYLLSKEYRLPYVVTAHGNDVLVLPKKYPKIIPHIVNSLENAWVSIFVSQALLESAKALGYSGKNGVVIPNGVDIERFTILDKKKIREELGIEKNAKVIGFVGSIIPVKRADRFFEIFSLIEEDIEDLTFLVVGDGLLLASLKKQFSKKKNVIFAGRVSPEEVPYYLNAMDLLILPSRKEGFGCVALEANACGIPVLGARVGGIPESVEDGGRLVEDGIDFEKRFSLEAIEILKRKVFDSGSLRERATTYSWDCIVKKEIAIYNKITGHEDKESGL
ncbi:MAG TPA: glycosyltransferase [Thermotogota bacterium]|nr:glycosyltransferase [Thermotogota bacterium]